MAEVVEAPVAAPQAELPLAEVDGVDVSRQSNIEQPKPAAKVAETPAPEATPAEKVEEESPESVAKREAMRQRRKAEKAYRQKAEAEARADLYRKELEARQQASKPADSGAPTLAQFEYDPEKYAAATADYAKTQATKEFQAKQQSESQKQYRERLLSGWEEKVDRAEEKYPDWREIVGDIKPDTPIAAAILEADNGEEIAYYLGKNPKEATRIAGLPIVSQIREIGKIEAKLQAQPPKAVAPSKAPPPVVPLKGTANPVSDEPSESDDYATWFKKRQKQVHGRRR